MKYAAKRVVDVRQVNRAGLSLILPWLLVVTVLALTLLNDIADLPTARVGSLLSPAPALAAIRSRPRAVALVSAAALCVAVLIAVTNNRDGYAYQLTVLGAVIAVGLVSTAASSARELREARMVQMQRVAEAAQLAVLPPVPRRAGELRMAARYNAAESEALIGGDLYEAVVRPGRARLLIGDVRGKGVPAIRTAAAVLGAFREAAQYEPTLTRTAIRCSEAVERLEQDTGMQVDVDVASSGGGGARLTAVGGPGAEMDPGPEAVEATELFVTATLVEIQGRMLRLVNLGHPPPLLMTPRKARFVEAVDTLPPLGLAHQLYGELPVQDVDWEPGDRLLLYTDGIIEARNAKGEFFPLLPFVETILKARTERVPDLLLEAVVRHAGSRLRDDAAVLAVEWAPPGDSA